jgi:hypothetical protein
MEAAGKENALGEEVERQHTAPDPGSRVDWNIDQHSTGRLQTIRREFVHGIIVQTVGAGQPFVRHHDLDGPTIPCKGAASFEYNYHQTQSKRN